jgi:hypothetical protein
MNFKDYLSGIAISCSLLAFCSCGEKQRVDTSHFTKQDSVTETYLNLKDSMLETWNSMINDDNNKLKAMHNLLHELQVSDPSHRDEYKAYEERLEQLASIRYTQKTMGEAQVVEEYDFASNALVTELISLTESQTQFSYNTTLQKLIETIRTADQRVDNYREEYDRITKAYNTFLEKNITWLKEIDEDSFLEKKPLFQMVSEE